MNHESDCECYVCQANSSGMSYEDSKRTILEQQKKFLDEYGFYIHLVFDDSSSPTGINIHTHGLEEKFQHLDFQIVVPLDNKVAHSILTTLVENIKSGVIYASGDYASRIIRNYKLKFLHAIENGRTVLRVIFPDINGNLEFYDMDSGYKVQYDGIIGESNI